MGVQALSLFPQAVCPGHPLACFSVRFSALTSSLDSALSTLSALCLASVLASLLEGFQKLLSLGLDSGWALLLFWTLHLVFRYLSCFWGGVTYQHVCMSELTRPLLSCCCSQMPLGTYPPHPILCEPALLIDPRGLQAEALNLGTSGWSSLIGKLSPQKGQVSSGDHMAARGYDRDWGLFVSGLQDSMPKQGMLEIHWSLSIQYSHSALVSNSLVKDVQ